MLIQSSTFTPQPYLVYRGGSPRNNLEISKRVVEKIKGLDVKSINASTLLQQVKDVTKCSSCSSEIYIQIFSLLFNYENVQEEELRTAFKSNKKDISDLCGALMAAYKLLGLLNSDYINRKNVVDFFLKLPTQQSGWDLIDQLNLSFVNLKNLSIVIGDIFSHLISPEEKFFKMIDSPALSYFITSVLLFTPQRTDLKKALLTHYQVYKGKSSFQAQMLFCNLITLPREETCNILGNLTPHIQSVNSEALHVLKAMRMVSPKQRGEAAGAIVQLFTNLLRQADQIKLLEVFKTIPKKQKSSLFNLLGHLFDKRLNLLAFSQILSSSSPKAKPQFNVAVSKHLNEEKCKQIAEDIDKISKHVLMGKLFLEDEILPKPEPVKVKQSKDPEVPYGPIFKSQLSIQLDKITYPTEKETPTFSILEKKAIYLKQKILNECDFERWQQIIHKIATTPSIWEIEKKEKSPKISEDQEMEKWKAGIVKRLSLNDEK